MLEWVAAATGVELSKLVLEQVLDLGKPVLEGYVQDFFQDCLNSGVTRLHATTLKTPMAEAIGYFIKRFVKELQLNDVAETSIQHHYKTALKQFVHDQGVRRILGKAFEPDCKQIDYGQLESIWDQRYQSPGWQFPTDEFDWRGIGKEYVYEVKGIIKANADLREILNSDLLANIARNTTQLSPGFDVEKYRHSLQCSYGYLKLYTLDSTDRVDAIKLWNIFIEQTVREALPPTRYELPTDLKRQLQEAGQFGDDLSADALEHYRHEYFQQPARKVLEAIGYARSSPALLNQAGAQSQGLPFQERLSKSETHDTQRVVILGDPGAGKSSLLQYLALEWVESQPSEVSRTSEGSRLPLLIELREFALTPATNFLEFLHRGRGVDWQFDQQQLHTYLQEQPTLVMFDGLDEIFDRATQATVIDDIIRFSQQYPQAQVLVTSRIIGYNPDRLKQSGFRHFTIQPLNTEETHAFIDRWYDLSMGADPDKARLKQRLKDAIANSRAIANLADNPLLLTMMAILNRRQELPRDRADLYDQASRVLLYHWDVDHKRLQIPMDAIGRREKQEILRLIAYEMQAGEEGLKGNLISSDRLTRIVTDYLRDQGFSEPREKANRLIQQLRDRNFILCYRGADTYGFMHRTFLEYFCAVEIVHRFEKQRTLTFDQLRDEVFGQHWQDETWHEVLRLICGMIDAKFAEELIEPLMSGGLMNLLLAVDCLSELNSPKTTVIREPLLSRLKEEAIEPEMELSWKASDDLLDRIARNYPETLQWLKHLTDELSFSYYNLQPKISAGAVAVVAKHYRSDPSTLPWLKTRIDNSIIWVPEAAFFAIAEYYCSNPNTLAWLKAHAQDSEEIISVSYRVIAKYYRDTPETLLWLRTHLDPEQREEVQRSVLEAIEEFYHDDPETFFTIKEQFYKVQPNESADASVKYGVAKIIAEKFPTHPEAFEFMCEVAQYEIPILSPYNAIGGYRGMIFRKVVEAFLTHYPTHSKTIELLRDRALNDPDEQLREWVQGQLQKLEAQS